MSTFRHKAPLRADGTPSDVGLIYIDRVDVAKLRKAIDIVDDSGVTDLLELWRDEDGYDKTNGGRPSVISERTVLVLMLTLALENKPLHVTKMAEIITDRATDNALKTLGLPARDKDDYTSRKGRKAWYDRAWSAFHRVMRHMNPYPDVSHARRLTVEEYEAVKAARTAEFVVARKTRLNMFNNALIMASARLIGEDYFNNWNGDVAVDGTAIIAANKGNRKGATRVSSEPEAGWYRRDDDHKGSTDGSAKTDLFWAYEATIAVMTGPKTDENQPSLIVGMTLDRPGKRIGQNAVAALTHIINDPALPKGHFIADRAYSPNSRAENLALPLRAAGYKIVGDQKVTTLGKKDEYKGAILVEGSLYIQGMPEQLINAGIDFREGRISEDVFHARIAAREKYALKIKTTKPNGDEVYYNPLNYGKYTTLIADGVKRPAGAPAGLTKLFEKDQPDKHLRTGLLTGQKTITYPRERRAELRVQGPRWSTPEWYAIYHRGRNTIEGINNKIKGGRYASIGDQTTRMVR